ncbi:hypothetical protein Bbelb_252570 [Branchiostoma belcheri]|nr:hypothetical protein Bbelb_252570 [Branchiostoma belcheri]
MGQIYTHTHPRPVPSECRPISRAITHGVRLALRPLRHHLTPHDAPTPHGGKLTSHPGHSGPAGSCVSTELGISHSVSGINNDGFLLAGSGRAGYGNGTVPGIDCSGNGNGKVLGIGDWKVLDRNGSGNGKVSGIITTVLLADSVSGNGPVPGTDGYGNGKVLGMGKVLGIGKVKGSGNGKATGMCRFRERTAPGMGQFRELESLTCSSTFYKEHTASAIRLGTGLPSVLTTDGLFSTKDGPIFGAGF